MSLKINKVKVSDLINKNVYLGVEKNVDLVKYTKKEVLFFYKSISILNIGLVITRLRLMLYFLIFLSSRRGNFLFLSVNYNNNFKNLLRYYALLNKQCFIVEPWVSGVLTNFSYFMQYNRLFQIKTGRLFLKKYLSKKSFVKFNKFFSGLKNTKGCIPNILIIFGSDDPNLKLDSLSEAISLGIPSIGIGDFGSKSVSLLYRISTIIRSVSSFLFFLNIMSLALKVGRQKEIIFFFKRIIFLYKLSFLRFLYNFK